MAAVNAIRTYLKEVIGLGANDAGTARANAMITEGLDCFDVLPDFTTEDIKALCYSIRKPGGQIEDPADVNALINNPGTSIPAIAESRLMTCVYGAAIYTRIERPCDAVSLSKTRLTEFKNHKEAVDNHDKPEPLQTISKTFGIMKLLEQFPTYLESKIGSGGVPLAYVIRQHATPVLPLPALAHGKPWSSEHTSLLEELIAFAKHDGPTFQTDNATVYRLLQEVLAGTQHMSSIKPFQSKRNGRGAYEALTLHNLGNSKWEKVVQTAETWVSTRTWDGRNSRYTLKAHISKHREAHNDFLRAEQYIAYAIPNEPTRVQRLLRSIQCKDGTILSAKTTILADYGKRNDFELASDFLLLVAPVTISSRRNHNISSFQSTRGGRKSRDPTVRYYAKSEWFKLSQDERTSITAKRKAQKHTGNGKKTKTGNGDSRIAALETKLAEQAQVIASFQTKEAPLPPTPAINPLQPPTGFTQGRNQN